MDPAIRRVVESRKMQGASDVCEAVGADQMGDPLALHDRDPQQPRQHARRGAAKVVDFVHDTLGPWSKRAESQGVNAGDRETIMDIDPGRTPDGWRKASTPTGVKLSVDTGHAAITPIARPARRRWTISFRMPGAMLEA